MIPIPDRKLFILGMPHYFMAEADLKAGLRSLRKSLRQIKALLAWEHLKQAEARPGQPPTFTLNDSIKTDLRNEYSFLLFTSMQMHSILNDGTARICKTKFQDIKQQLAKIEQQLYSLNLPQRFG